MECTSASTVTSRKRLPKSAGVRGTNQDKEGVMWRWFARWRERFVVRRVARRTTRRTARRIGRRLR